VQAIENSKPSNTIELLFIIAPSYAPMALYLTFNIDLTLILHGDDLSRVVMIPQYAPRLTSNLQTQKGR
jgi:hypothetical protein